MENSKISSFIYYSLLAVVCLSPLPFASNRPWSWNLLALLVFIIVGVFAVKAYSNKDFNIFPVEKIKYITLLFLSVVGWSAIQIMPLPFGSAPLWQITAETLNVDAFNTISIDHYQTITAITKLLTYGVIFLLAVNLGQSSSRSSKVFKALAYTGGLYAFYGLYIQISGANSILGYERWAYTDFVTSTFVNRNSYATFAGMGIIISTGLFLSKLFRNSNGLKGKRFYKKLIDNFFENSYMYLILSMLILAALLLTASRAGLVSTFIGLIVLITFFISKKSSSKHNKTWAFSLILLIVSSFAITINLGGDNTFKRMHKIEDDNGRQAIYKATVDAIETNPITGTGYGTFEQAFHPYIDANFSFYHANVSKAHSTYLELAMELGIPAAVALITVILLIVWRCIQGIGDRKKNSIYPIVGVAISVLIGVHAIVDFSIQIPAVAATYSLIMGVCFAQSFSSKNNSIAVNNKTVYGGLIALSAIVIFISSYNFNVALKQLAGNEILNEFQLSEKVPDIKDIKIFIESREATFIPANGRDKQDAALFKILESEVNEVEKEKLLKQAYSELVKGLAISPSNPYAWLRLSYLEWTLGYSEKDIADSLELSILTGPNEPKILIDRISYAFAIWDSLDDDKKYLINKQIAYIWEYKKHDLIKSINDKKILNIIVSALDDEEQKNYAKRLFKQK